MPTERQQARWNIIEAGRMPSFAYGVMDGSFYLTHHGFDLFPT